MTASTKSVVGRTLELGVALIVLAFAGGVGEALAARYTGWIGSAGRWSYEIYLTHMFVLLG
jgi:peptidoglycan/LPS O-acetylase OafA/YrhL